MVIFMSFQDEVKKGVIWLIKPDVFTHDKIKMVNVQKMISMSLSRLPQNFISIPLMTLTFAHFELPTCLRLRIAGLFNALYMR